MPLARKSVTASPNSSGTTTWTVVTNESTATAVGDLVIVIHTNDYYALSAMGTPTATGLPTMTAISGATADGGGTTNPHIKAWWYVANTAAAQTVTATESGSPDEERCVIAVVYGGADTTTPIDAATNVGLQASSTSMVAPSVSPATSDAELLVVVCPASSSNASFAPPGTVTELFDGGVAGIWRMTIAGATLSASGATGTRTFTATVASAYVASAITIKAAAGAAPVMVPVRRNRAVHRASTR